MSFVLLLQKKTSEKDQIIQKIISLKEVRVLAYKEVIEHQQNYIKRLAYILMQMALQKFRKQFKKKQKQLFYVQEELNLIDWIKQSLQDGMKQKIQEIKNQNKKIQIQTLKKLQKQQKSKKCQSCQQLSGKCSQLNKKIQHLSQKENQLSNKNYQLAVQCQQNEIRLLEMSQKQQNYHLKQKKNSAELKKSRDKIQQLQTLIQKLRKKMIKNNSVSLLQTQQITFLEQQIHKKSYKIQFLQKQLRSLSQKHQKLIKNFIDLTQQRSQSNKKICNLSENQKKLIKQLQISKLRNLQKQNLAKYFASQVNLLQIENKNLEEQIKKVENKYCVTQQILKNLSFSYEMQMSLKKKQLNQISKEYYSLISQLKLQKIKVKDLQAKLEHLFDYIEYIQQQLKLSSNEKINQLSKIKQLNKLVQLRQKEHLQQKLTCYQSKSISFRHSNQKRIDRISTSPSGKLFNQCHEIQSFDEQFNDQIQQFNLLKKVEVQQNKHSLEKHTQKLQFFQTLNIKLNFENKDKKKLKAAQIQTQEFVLLVDYFLKQEILSNKQQLKIKKETQDKDKENIINIFIQRKEKNIQTHFQNQKINSLSKQNEIFHQFFEKEVQTVQNQYKNLDFIQNFQELQQISSSDSDQQYYERDSFTQTTQMYYKQKKKMQQLQMKQKQTNKQLKYFQVKCLNLQNSLKKSQRQKQKQNLTSSQLKSQNFILKLKLNEMQQQYKKSEQVYHIKTKQDQRHLSSYIQKQVVKKYMKEILNKENTFDKKFSALNTLCLILDSDQHLINLSEQYRKWQTAKYNYLRQDVKNLQEKDNKNKQIEQQQFYLKFMRFLTKQED